MTLSPLRARKATCLAVLALVGLLTSPLGTVLAHEHHSDTPLPPTGDPTPVDWILKMHIFFMFLAYVVCFPIGAIFGLTKYHLHVPLQTVGAVLAAFGYAFGHLHGGRRFEESAHSANAWLMLYLLAAQIGFGVFLKLNKRQSRARSILRIAHSLLGIAHPILAYVQLFFGLITWNAFCAADHKGNCLAHFIMGSSIAWYGVFSLWAAAAVGQAWIRRRGRSVEFYEGWLIAGWGLVNSLTEHTWGGEWFHNDIQHTALGVLWLVGGISSIVFTHYQPTLRSPFPAVVLLLTGAAMGAHAQHSMIGTMVHGWFGKAIMVASLTRIIEVVIDKREGMELNSVTPAGGQQKRTLYGLRILAGFLLILGGFMFSSSQEEALATIDHSILDPVSYMLIICSVAFTFFGYAQGLITLYENLSPSRTLDVQYGRLGDRSHDVPGVQDFDRRGSPGLDGRDSLFDINEVDAELLEDTEELELKTVN